MASSERSERAGSPDPGRALGVLIDTLVVSPLESGLRAARDPLGAFARARQELRNARAVGGMVLGSGRTRSGAAEAARPTRTGSGRGEEDEVADSVSATSDDADDGTSDDADVSGADASDVGAEDLAVPDYDQLPAIDIVGQLGALSAGERDRIEEYELANRRRRTILGKIEQLRGGGST